MPFFWASATPPNELLDEWSGQVFLKWNGATFSATQYPKLAVIIPSLRLTESRGEFPRIWDDGRGVDNGRAILSAQGDAIRNITGQFSAQSNGSRNSLLTEWSGAFSSVEPNTFIPSEGDSTSTAKTRPRALLFSAANVVPTANENRSRNIAFNFLVRAK